MQLHDELDPAFATYVKLAEEAPAPGLIQKMGLGDES